MDGYREKTSKIETRNLKTQVHPRFKRRALTLEGLEDATPSNPEANGGS